MHVWCSILISLLQLAEDWMPTIMHSEKPHKRTNKINRLDFCCLSLEPFRRLTLLFFPNNCSQSTGHWAQHCDTALQPFHHLISPVQHNSEPGKHYGTMSPASAGLWWTGMSRVQWISHPKREPYPMHLSLSGKNSLSFVFFSPVSQKADLGYAEKTVSQVYDQVWIDSCAV